jgi:hypothetical protein
MIKSKATEYGEEYDYCRTCKKELSEMEVKVVLELVDDPFKGYREELLRKNIIFTHSVNNSITTTKISVHNAVFGSDSCFNTNTNYPNHIFDSRKIPSAHLGFRCNCGGAELV